MHETRRLLDAASALSQLLRDNEIPHAFYGSVLSATLANSMHGDAGTFLVLCVCYPDVVLPFRKYTVLLKVARVTHTRSGGSETPCQGRKTGQVLTRPGQTGMYCGHFRPFSSSPFVSFPLPSGSTSLIEH